MKNLKLSFVQLDFLVKELKSFAQGSHCLGMFQKNSKEFYLLFEKKGKKEALFFSFSSPFIGFYLTPHFPSHCSPCSFLSRLKDSTLQQIEVINQDCILKINFQTSKGIFFLVAEFFNKHPNFYSLSFDYRIHWALYPLTSPFYRLPPPPLFSSISCPLFSHQEVEFIYKSQKLNQEKASLTSYFKGQLQSLKKKISKFQQALKKCQKWQEIEHEGELIKSYFSSYPKGQKEWKIEDWKTGKEKCLILDSLQTAQQAMQNRFCQAKKLRLGHLPLQNQIELNQKKCTKIEFSLRQLELISTLEDLEAFQKMEAPLFSPWLPFFSIKQSSQSTSKVYREYLSISGIKIWVGRQAKMNEILTFKLARGNDVWLHVQDFPGAHVIIHPLSNQTIDQATLQEAMQLALYYSQVKEGGEVCYTQKKYVTRLKKGTLGQVQISKHQLKWVQKDKNLCDSILKRSKSLSFLN